MDARQVHPLVDAVQALAVGAEAGRRDAAHAAEGARVGGGGDRDEVRRLAAQALDGRAQRAHQLRRGVELVALDREAVVAHLRWEACRGPDPRRPPGDRRLDAGPQLRQPLSGEEGEPAAQHALRGDRGAPVAALDDADVEVDRPLVHGERGGHVEVELRLQRAQRPHDREARLDGVDAGGRGAGVGRRARDAHVEPEHAELRDGDRDAEGLRDDGGVRGAAGEHALERAVAAALLLHDALQLEGRARRHAERPQRPHGADDGGEARLHVGGAAAVQPVAVAGGAERRRPPEVRLLGRHDVDVAVEDERAPDGVHARRRAPRRDDVALALDVPGEGRVRRVGAQRGGVERDVDRLEPRGRVRLRHHGLPGLLLAEHRGLLHEPHQQVLDGARLGPHGGGDRGVLDLERRAGCHGRARYPGRIPPCPPSLSAERPSLPSRRSPPSARCCACTSSTCR